MGTTSIVKKACPCYFNDLEKTEVLEHPVKSLNEISFDDFKSKIPNKIYKQMLEDKFPNYIQTDDNSVKTVLEDNSVNLLGRDPLLIKSTKLLTSSKVKLP